MRERERETSLRCKEGHKMRAGGEIFSESKNVFGQVLWYSLKLLAEKTCPMRCEVCRLEKVT